MALVRPVFAFLLLSAASVWQTSGQCPVSSRPAISSNVVCDTSGVTLTYICNAPGNFLFWTSTLFSAGNNELIVISTGGDNPGIGLAVSGVTAMETHTRQSSCLNSTLTFTGTNLTALNGITLKCRENDVTINDTVTISVPNMPRAPQIVGNLSSTCDAMGGGNQVSLQWTSPNYTGRQEILRYLVDVSGFMCSPHHCNVTTTNTTITGLLCNTSYTVTVRAVNCIGEGTPSEPVPISVNADVKAPLITQASYTNNTVMVEWRNTQSACYSVDSNSISISSNNRGVVHRNDNVQANRIAVRNLTTSAYFNVSLISRTSCGNSSEITTVIHIQSPYPTLSSSVVPSPTCPANCDVCESSSCCQRCSSGYELSSRNSCQCVAVAQMCTIDNRAWCSNNNSCCRQCADGYSVSNCLCTEESGGLTPGHIAGIVVGVLLGIILLSVPIALLLIMIGYHIGHRKKSSSKSSYAITDNGGNATHAKPTTNDSDVETINVGSHKF